MDQQLQRAVEDLRALDQVLLCFLSTCLLLSLVFSYKLLTVRNIQNTVSCILNHILYIFLVISV